MKNIKLLMLGLLFFSGGSSIWAQKSFGVRAGANFSTVSGGDLQGVESVTGYYVGAYKELPIIKKVLFIQPELQFSKQGFKLETQDINLNYLYVPIMAKVYLLKFLSLETGPQFGFKVGESSSYYSDYNNFDKAWAAGLGFHLPFGLSVDFRYIGSFDEFAKGTDAKNQVVQAGLGFRF